MSPKIYFIKKEGKYFNSRDNYWYSSITNANYERSRKVLDELMKLPKYEGCEVHETTEEQFMEQLATSTTDLVIAGEYFSRLLFNTACKIPTISQVNKTMYQKCRIAIECLTPFSEMHSQFLNAKEDITDDVSGHYSEFIHCIGSVNIYQMAEITSIINAYKSDRASIIGIAKKVLKN